MCIKVNYIIIIFDLLIRTAFGENFDIKMICVHYIEPVTRDDEWRNNLLERIFTRKMLSLLNIG